MSRHYPPDYCDADEMAYLLSMGKTTFLEYVAAGSLPQGVKLGHKRLWSRARVIQALDEMQSPEKTMPGILEAARGAKAKARGHAA